MITYCFFLSLFSIEMKYYIEVLKEIIINVKFNNLERLLRNTYDNYIVFLTHKKT